MIVGTEWLIEAEGCAAEKLRDLEIMQKVFAKIISDLSLKTIGEISWHKFEGEGGITGLAMLTESHLACHTYPEHETATFNLYCCRSRPEWNWKENLKILLDAESVNVTKIERGNKRNAVILTAVPPASSRRDAANKSSENKLVNYGEVKIRERGRLPHWEKEDGIYFVTFRLADSLPQDILKTLESERKLTEKILANLERDLSIAESRKFEWLFCEKVDEYLDKNYGECHLQKAEAAEIVINALRHFENSRYHLFAWCVMPNHVHVLFHPLQKNKLDEILHSWKSFTANEINKILKSEGRFWQREYYDHLVRSQDEFERIIQYILDNPIKANLKIPDRVWAFEKYNNNVERPKERNAAILAAVPPSS